MMTEEAIHEVIAQQPEEVSYAFFQGMLAGIRCQNTTFQEKIARVAIEILEGKRKKKDKIDKFVEGKSA